MYDYVRNDTAKLTYMGKVKGKPKGMTVELLWGDRVKVIKRGKKTTKVKARGFPEGEVKNSDLGGESLLELYFIDVGQGDGILIRTPDHRHILIDGGYKRSKLDTGKNAADFVDWKFFKDYGEDTIKLDAIIASHCDADHYGGLWDLINPDESRELDCKQVEVDAFYHAGVAWWKGPKGRYLGPKTNGYLTQLMGGKTSIKKALSGSSSGPKLQGEWADFLRCVVKAAGTIQRLSHIDEYIPGFGPGENDATFKILAPVEYDLGGKPALRSLGGKSQNTNGHSILLRLDYGRTRILLTGDLNKKSQRALLEAYEGERLEFMCDVAKGCHHGSDDISYEFLQTMCPAATIISSGDNESHSHPRPSIVAASGLTGHMEVKKDELVTPLVFSTEIARSIQIGRDVIITAKDYTLDDGSSISVILDQTSNARATYKVTKAGALRPKHKSRYLKGLNVISGIVYGLVNVRTDGSKILCATRNEGNHNWEINQFTSRF